MHSQKEGASFLVWKAKNKSRHVPLKCLFLCNLQQEWQAFLVILLPPKYSEIIQLGVLKTKLSPWSPWFTKSPSPDYTTMIHSHRSYRVLGFSIWLALMLITTSPPFLTSKAFLPAVLLWILVPCPRWWGSLTQHYFSNFHMLNTPIECCSWAFTVHMATENPQAHYYSWLNILTLSKFCLQLV